MRENSSLQTVRFGYELSYADALAGTPLFQRLAGEMADTPAADRVRRKLLAGHVRLSENMAPDVFAHARYATQGLRMTSPVEIYQAAGEGNASNWTCAEVCFVALQGNMLSLLDRESFIALFGHEFGHHLAHTTGIEKKEHLMALQCAASIAHDSRIDTKVRVLASRVAMGMEFTADRYAAVAAGGLDGPLRLMMAVVTGLPAERLNADSECYLEQARALFDTHGSAETSPTGSHPEHLLRAYALSLFVESDVFQKLTGKGPGTRKLVEVEEALHRILTDSDERFFESDLDEPLPPEMQEFSLCAAVLMADCDGDLDEEEAKAIEETFAESVPGWMELLHPEHALKRFGELLPLAISGGERAATSVFHVLVHIMLVDRQVHVRELEMISAIGRSMRQGVLFNYLLAAVARKFRVERTEVVERPLPALPPGQHEAEAALKGMLAGMSRRGGGSVALTRLLRIVGKPAWDDGVRSLTLHVAQAHHLELVAEPVVAEDGMMRPDQPLFFRLTDKEARRRDQAAHEEETNALAQVKTRDALLTALKHLRERLVSGDGRSPSVRLYRANTGKHFDLAQLDRVIAGRSERVVAMLHDATTIPMLSGAEAGLSKTSAEVSSAIRQLEREFKARVEETGSRDLFVGYPFLIGVVGGFFVRAPLVLHPFSVVGDGKGSGSFTLKKREDDEAIANQALIRLLFAKKGYAFTEDLAATLDAKAAEGVQELLMALKDIGLDAAPLSGAITPFEEMNAAAASLLPEVFAISENAVAGFFPQSSSDLLQDYDELLAKLEPDSTASLEQSLNAACDVLPAHYRPVFTAAAGADAPDQPVIYADPSQRAAVLRSRASRLLVMDGPPGTGKSQTIVNLVADELARGGRIGIVCEKRVALDVVKQRMDAAGIGHLAVVVHDVYDDRKALYQNIANRLEQVEKRTFDPQKLAELRGEATTLEDQLAFRGRMLAAPTACGLTLGQLHSMAASFGVESVYVAGMESVPHAELPRLTLALREIHPHARLFSRGSPFRAAPEHAPRASFADMNSTQIQEVATSLRQAQQAAQTYEQLYAADPLPREPLENAEKALRLAVAVACQGDTLADTFGQMLVLRAGPGDAANQVENAFAEMERHRVAAEAVQSRVEMQPSNELTVALATAGAKVGSFFKFLMPSWRKACAMIRETLVREWPEKIGVKIDAALLAQLTQRTKASQAWLAAEQIYKSLNIASHLPREASALFEKNKALIQAWQISGQIAREKVVFDSVGLWPLSEGQFQPDGGWKVWTARCQKALDLLAAQKAYLDALNKVTHLFPQAHELSAAGLEVLADRFIADEASLRAADRLLATIATFIPGPHQLVETLVDVLSESSATIWAEAVLRGWAESWLVVAETADPSLKLLDQAPLGSVEKASARLIELHHGIAREESLRLAACGDARGLMSVPAAEARARRTPEQAVRETLIRECRKQRNVTAMRTLIRRHAREGLLDVLPVWLMSPETTAILFPREPVFDLLIIDEASQCTVENGLPVLTRARRAVIAGDDKQMPPTSFFKASTGIGVDQDEHGESDVPVDAFESESLLVLARHSGARAPLRWHYRALYEELIAFSNHSMYGGSLLTIPATLSRSAPPAMRWVRIEDGRWDAGSNLPEAKHVVDVLGGLLSRPNPPSVGIVTFNLQQRKAILDEIDARRANDSTFAEVYDKATSHESLDQRPFVKNLESVQGDERDVIIFSLGYAPVKRARKGGVEETYVPARFGPLGQKGGERRLNVAVSRAKHEIIVVSSFDPAMLSVAHTKNDGPRMFKAFVEFACHLGAGRRNQAEKILSLVNDASQRRNSTAKLAPESVQTLPLYHQISLALEAAGLHVETLVGTSEFRLPMAIVHADNTHHYALAILCDDGSVQGDPYEDHVHVPNVLKYRGWRYLRVHSREWHYERERVIERIRDALAA